MYTVTIVKAGKPARAVEASTYREAFEKAGALGFEDWHITNSNTGLTVENLDATVQAHTTLICGDRVEGA